MKKLEQSESLPGKERKKYMSGNAEMRTNNNLKGMFWVVLGVIIFGSVLDWWDIGSLLDGWWTLFIIIPCARKVMRYGLQTPAGFGLIVGIALLLAEWDVLRFGSVAKLAGLLVLAVFAIKVLRRNVHFQGSTSNVPPQFAEEARCSAFFGGADVVYPHDPYFGSEVNAVFGGADLDLRNAMIDEDVVINATAVFGGVTIKLPEDVNIRLDSTAIFGGNDNKIKRPEQPEWPIVYVRATSIFGGVEIK